MSKYLDHITKDQRIKDLENGLKSIDGMCKIIFQHSNEATLADVYHAIGLIQQMIEGTLNEKYPVRDD